MELSKFRQKLQNSALNSERTEHLPQEDDSFSAVAPNAKNRTSSLLTTIIWVLVAGALYVLLPQSLNKIPLACLAFWFSIQYHSEHAEYDSKYNMYNFNPIIGESTLQLLDEKLAMCFHPDPSDLVDRAMPYFNALVEAHMIRPPRGEPHVKEFAHCSYAWWNQYNTDSFEYLACRIYTERKDKYHNIHENVCFDGFIYKFHTSFTINGTLHIMSTISTAILGVEMERNPFKHVKHHKVAVIDTENHEFDTHFDVLATYDEDAYQYLTPTMMETLLAFRQRYSFSICIKGNVMTVAIENNGLKFAKPLVFDARLPIYDLNHKTEAPMLLGAYRDALLSIYELKDRLDPGGRCGMA